MVRYGGVEAGGTKFVCVVGSGPGAIHDRRRIPTTDPESTLTAVVEFFREAGPLKAVGVAAFGPLELRRSSSMWGSITATPKPGWSGVNFVSALSQGLGVPVGIDTDVNGAALAEWRWGAGRGLDPVVYVTVGTGVGGGAVVGGRPLHGSGHPEMGHVSVPRQAGDEHPGSCPFHGDCLEGMASGPAIEARWGRRAEDLGDLTPEAAALEARYLAAGLRQVAYVLAPMRIVVGGGVAQLPGLVEEVGRRLSDQMAGYGPSAAQAPLSVTRPGLGRDSGVLGALALAEMAVAG